MSPTQPSATGSKNNPDDLSVRPKEKAPSSESAHKPSTTGNDANTDTATGKTVSGIIAWGFTSGKPYLASPRLDDPKSSSVITSYLPSMMGGKQSTNGSGQG
ncbi:hypothetical protein LTR84_006230 [Exophiala bonariae]|uniref:Uncharacterized protein n=1 Tax=Exophiala bonariae TaxID=1690606 RepID=A0AAV9N4R7_9EURO|nr:hypothetical protein LTR84_006230 [Exophiala bonariae]